MIIGFIIWSAVSVLFVGIGINSRKSDEPAGFFTGCKPPKIENVSGYNKAVWGDHRIDCHDGCIFED